MEFAQVTYTKTVEGNFEVQLIHNNTIIAKITFPTESLAAEYVDYKTKAKAYADKLIAEVTANLAKVEEETKVAPVVAKVEAAAAKVEAKVAAVAEKVAEEAENLMTSFKAKIEKTPVTDTSAKVGKDTVINTSATTPKSQSIDTSAKIVIE